LLNFAARRFRYLPIWQSQAAPIRVRHDLSSDLFVWFVSRSDLCASPLLGLLDTPPFDRGRTAPPDQATGWGITRCALSTAREDGGNRGGSPKGLIWKGGRAPDQPGVLSSSSLSNTNGEADGCRIFRDQTTTARTVALRGSGLRYMFGE
jgi:hypothetical protein